MRSLRYLSAILLIVVVSCSPVKKSTLTEVKHDDKAPEWESPFSKDFDKAMFKASLDVRGKHLSGIALIKKTSDTSFHFSFANEIGMTYFDLELWKDSYRCDYVFGPLNKKAFLNILQHDFRVLLFTGSFCGNPSHYKDPVTLDNIYYYSASSLFAYFNKENGKLTRLAGWSNLVDAVLIGLEYTQGPFPSGINILNPRIGMLLDLNLLGR
ncbi:MAG: hypothetical protein WCI48_08455 [Bacteroidota bacterium]|jgi:hypothetical protein